MIAEDASVHLRIPSSTWTAGIGWTVLAVLLAEPVIRGQWHYLFAYGPGVLLVAWLLYVVFWAPGITVTSRTAIVRNMLTTTTIPYPRIVDISVRLLVTVVYRDNAGRERKITSWNAPGLPKIGRSLVRPGIAQHDIASAHSQAENAKLPLDAAALTGTSQVLLDTWEQHEYDPDAPVSHRIHWVNIAITSVLACVTVLVNL